jgi:hypothetical protein
MVMLIPAVSPVRKIRTSCGTMAHAFASPKIHLKNGHFTDAANRSLSVMVPPERTLHVFGALSILDNRAVFL